ncbi:MAG: ABC transporter ATP-binding protein [Parvularculaceae bacterium]
MFSYFEKRIDPFPEARQGPPPKPLVQFCWHYVKDAAPLLVLMSVFTALISVGEVLLFGFLGRIVDWLSAADRENFLSQEQGALIAMGALILIGLPAAVLFRSLIIHQALLGNLPMSARWRMHSHLLGQSLGFFANEFAGRVAAKVMQTSLAVRETVMKILDVFVYVAVYFTAMIGLIIAADWRLALPLIVWLAVYVLILRYFIPKLRSVSEKQADARAAMTGRIVDSYTNIATVKLFAHGGREAGYARESMDEFLKTVHPQMRLVTQFEVANYINNSIVVFVIAGLSIALWVGGQITIGAIATGIALTLRINGMSQWIMWEVSGLFENIGTVYDGMGTMTRPTDVLDAPEARALTCTKGGIEFDRVKFHYGREEGLIEEFSLKVAPGEKIGLVGRSGAGKSTLVNLLLRFYDVEGGRILIDGEDISRVTQESLRGRIGVVTQDTSLMHRSIRENIAYGKLAASDAEIVEAARRANALDFILKLEDQKGRKGFDAHVGERGVKLSGGQRQRIAIARIFLKDAPILVLDEATSALDSEIEAAIQENLFQLMRGKTVIAIAHRLSTISQLDRLIVLDEGGIIEAGAHGELVRAGGLYAELWARQSGGFLTQPKAPAQAAE